MSVRDNNRAAYRCGRLAKFITQEVVFSNGKYHSSIITILSSSVDSLNCVLLFFFFLSFFFFFCVCVCFFFVCFFFSALHY